MSKHKPSFFERLTGAIRIDDAEEDFFEEDHKEERHLHPKRMEDDEEKEEIEELPEEMGELTIDMYENDKEIVIKSIVAGVRFFRIHPL